MSRYGIVVVGYNRTDSLERILESLNNAFYDEMVDLIISLDNSGIQNVFIFADKFNWKHGTKRVILAKKKLGLRDHILKCGNYLNEFDFQAIILLEDDLYVSPDFFNYSKQAVDFYKDDNRIAGISLYQHLWNLNADRPFAPVVSGNDMFFMQYPQSWGQVWIKEQWNDFYKWYKDGKYRNIDIKTIPENVLKWPESSWLKYHVQYCITENKFFVYPYCGLSTNFADAGTHYAFNTNKMQIPIVTKTGKRYKFSTIDRSSVVYDAFFENIMLATYLDVSSDELTVDLYGMKSTYKRYLLTMRKLPYKILKKFGLQMRPQDINVIFNINGDNIILYDTVVQDKSNMTHDDIDIVKWNYDSRGTVLYKQKLVKLLRYEIYQKLQVYKTILLKKVNMNKLLEILKKR